MVWLSVLCAGLASAVLVLGGKLVLLRRAAKEIRAELADRLSSDTNAGLDLSCGDRSMRQLAAELDQQLKALRREHARFASGDRALKEAITNLSHDLRTPLTSICGYLDLLEQEEMTEAAARYLKLLANRVAALKELTEELFRYSLVLSGQRYETREPVVLNQALEESLAAFYAAFQEKGITPDIRIPEARVVRPLNRAALSRILSNILSNALKYSDGDLSVTLEPNGRLFFSNYAKQLDAVQTAKLFDRFFTVESGQDATGLGLSIARTLTEQLHGTISADYHQGRLRIMLDFSQV